MIPEPIAVTWLVIEPLTQTELLARRSAETKNPCRKADE